MKKIPLLVFVLFCFTTFTLPAQKMGLLWGMTESGGIYGSGVIFNYNMNNYYDSVVSTFSLDATKPQNSSLLLASDHNYYGMTPSGGQNGKGAIFRYKPNGKEIMLHNFGEAAPDGTSPYGSLIQASDGNLYGMTYGGGTFGKGTIFKYTLAGIETVIYNFTGSTGANPYGSLTQAKDGYLYGMTYEGGANNQGTIFKCSTSGVETVICNLVDSTGGFPHGSLIQGFDSNLYGMTTGGGKYGNGTIFSCKTTGVKTVLHNFPNLSTDGAVPYGKIGRASCRERV